MTTKTKLEQMAERVTLKDSEFTREIVTAVRTEGWAELDREGIDWHELGSRIHPSLWRDSEEYCDMVVERLRAAIDEAV